MEEHLGYAKHAVEGRNHGNSRNGTRSKTVITEIGPGRHRRATTLSASSSSKASRETVLRERARRWRVPLTQACDMSA
jgi:hypothetical protein